MDRPTCNWWISGDWGHHGRRCDRAASFMWGDRPMCANHAASWLRVGKTMTRLVDVNPYPGNDEGLWERTADPRPANWPDPDHMTGPNMKDVG
jgi:hypothetical protein